MKEGLALEATSEQIGRLLVRTGAYLVNLALPPEQWYEWKSGIKAPCYLNCRLLKRFPNARSAVTQALTDSIAYYFPDVEWIAGVATAGTAWSGRVSDLLGLPEGHILKESKKHGVGGLVDVMAHGTRVVIVDDLVASGESVAKAIAALNAEYNAKVIGVQSIVNWGFAHMCERLHGLNVTVRALCSYPHILDAALQLGYIDSADRIELDKFYRDPKRHVWKNPVMATA